MSVDLTRYTSRWSAPPTGAKCGYCGATGLLWLDDSATVSPGRKPNYWQAVPVWNSTTYAWEGVKHVCPAGTSRVGKPTQRYQVEVERDPPEGSETLDAEVERLIGSLQAAANTNMAEVRKTAEAWLERVNTGGELLVENLARELPLVVGNLVERAVRDAVPQTHEVHVTRWDGTEKKLAGRPHKHLRTLVGVLSQRVHTFLVGPAGSGKTTAAQMAAEVLGLPYYEKAMGPATSEWDLTGYRSPDGKYVPGALRAPFEHGGVATLDEVDNAGASVLTALNTMMANGYYTFPDARVPRHPDFIVVACGNTYGRGADRLYVGRQQLDAATLDRFAVLDWDYDEEAEVEWAGTDQRPWTTYVQAVRHAAAQHKMRFVVSPRASITGAKLLRSGLERSLVEEAVLWKGLGIDDRSKLERSVPRR